LKEESIESRQELLTGISRKWFKMANTKELAEFLEFYLDKKRKLLVELKKFIEKDK